MALKIDVRKDIPRHIIAKSGLKRFLRVIIPQILALIPTLMGLTKPVYAPLWATGGAFLTALDKIARDSNWY